MSWTDYDTPSIPSSTRTTATRRKESRQNPPNLKRVYDVANGYSNNGELLQTQSRLDAISAQVGEWNRFGNEIVSMLFLIASIIGIWFLVVALWPADRNSHQCAMCSTRFKCRKLKSGDNPLKEIGRAHV